MLSHFATLTPALSINWKLQKFYRTCERSSSAKTARRKTLGFPPHFEDLVSNFTRLVTDRKAERLNRDHRMAKNALSKFSYNRSSFLTSTVREAQKLSYGGTRVWLSWKHDSFRRWIRQPAITCLRTCLNNNL